MCCSFVMLEFSNLANLCIIATTEWIFLAGGKFVGYGGWSCKVFAEVMMTFSARATVGNYQHIAAQSELNQVYQYCRGRGSLKVFVNIPSGWHENDGHPFHNKPWEMIRYPRHRCDTWWACDTKSQLTNTKARLIFIPPCPEMWAPWLYFYVSFFSRLT